MSILHEKNFYTTTALLNFYWFWKYEFDPPPVKVDKEQNLNKIIVHLFNFRALY